MWHSDNAEMHFRATVHSSPDAQLVGAEFVLEVVVTATMDGGLSGKVRLLFDTEPDQPPVDGHVAPLEYNGIVSVEIHVTGNDRIIIMRPNKSPAANAGERF